MMLNSVPSSVRFAIIFLPQNQGLCAPLPPAAAPPEAVGKVLTDVAQPDG